MAALPAAALRGAVRGRTGHIAEARSEEQKRTLPIIVQTAAPLELANLGVSFSLPVGWRAFLAESTWHFSTPEAVAQLTLSTREQKNAPQTLKARQEGIERQWKERGFELRSSQFNDERLVLSLYKTPRRTELAYVADQDRLLILALEGEAASFPADAWDQVLETLDVKAPTEFESQGTVTGLHVPVSIRPKPDWTRETIAGKGRHISYAGPYFEGNQLRWRFVAHHHHDTRIESVRELEAFSQTLSAQVMRNAVPNRLMSSSTGRWGLLPAVIMDIEFAAPPVLEDVQAYLDLEQLRVFPQTTQLNILVALLDDHTLLSVWGLFPTAQNDVLWQAALDSISVR